MLIHEILEKAGKHKRRKRIGRGIGSGTGKTSGKGHKGCQARSGGGTRPLHEGGQMPLFRRIPKRGFSNFNFRTEYEIVNLGDLSKHFKDGDKVDAEALKKAGLIRGNGMPVKVLGKGTLDKKITIAAHATSAAAKDAIEKSGGSLKMIEDKSAADKWSAKRRTVKTAGRKPAEK